MKYVKEDGKLGGCQRDERDQYTVQMKEKEIIMKELQRDKSAEYTTKTVQEIGD